MIKNRIAHKLFSLFVITILLGSGSFLFEAPTVSAQNVSDVKAQEAELKQKLKELEAEIAAQEKELAKQKGQSASISGEISLLKGEIQKTKLDIERKNTLIRQLSGEIEGKKKTISQLNQELGREKASLAQLVRQTNDLDSYSPLEVLLGKKNISEFFIDNDSFGFITQGLTDSFNTIRSIQGKTTVEQQALEEKKNREADIKAALETDKKTVEQKEGQKQTLLNISKTKEKTYEEVIKERQARAAQIRAQLFELAGGVPGGGIPFGQAVEYAKVASAKTGVRTAFILGVLEQESALGKNIGTCNRPGDARTWKQVMPGPGQSWRDDQAAYLQIVQELGLSPEGQPMSCPGGGGGWGGALGPSQFIPTTWLGIRGRVANILGIELANPWRPQHAIMATALYLQDLGAGAGGYTAERNAACKYYSGRTCGASSIANTFYGDGVLAKASIIDNNIKFLDDND